MENKIFAYMRISTNKKTQKVDRQKQTIIEYSVNNNFKIDEFVSDAITGGTKADNRPHYHDMKKQLRSGDTLIISDVDRLGRNADDVIVEIKELQSCNAALYSRRKKHFIFASITTITAHSFLRLHTAVKKTAQSNRNLPA